MNELRTLRFAELLDHAWKALRRHFKTLFLPFALMLTPLLLVIHIVSNYYSLQMMDLGDNADLVAMFTAFGIFFVVIIGLSLISVLVYRGMFVCACWADRQRSYSWGTGLTTYLNPKFWLTDLLATVLIMIGFLACLLPGVFLMLVWSLRLPVMVHEGKFGWQALSRSFELVQFNPSKQISRSALAKVFGALIVVLVLSTAVSLVVQLPISAWTQYVTFKEAAEGNLVELKATLARILWISLPFSLLAGLAQLAVSLYSNFILAALFSDQRRRREGDDISGRLDGLLAQTEPATAPLATPPATPAGSPGGSEDGWGEESWTLPSGDPKE